MSVWRRKALQLLPEFRPLIDSADSPMALWIEMHLRFDHSMGSADSQRANRILEFAAWCISSASGPLPNDTSTAAAVAFYEHLPVNRDYWKYFPKWFSRVQFEELLPIFSHHLDQKDIAEFRRCYGSMT